MTPILWIMAGVALLWVTLVLFPSNRRQVRNIQRTGGTKYNWPSLVALAVLLVIVLYLAVKMLTLPQ